MIRGKAKCLVTTHSGYHCPLADPCAYLSLSNDVNTDPLSAGAVRSLNRM